MTLRRRWHIFISRINLQEILVGSFKKRNFNFFTIYIPIMQIIECFSELFTEQDPPRITISQFLAYSYSEYSLNGE